MLTQRVVQLSLWVALFGGGGMSKAQLLLSAKWCQSFASQQLQNAWVNSAAETSCAGRMHFRAAPLQMCC
jgi:hypothetical protein